jgi:hypothetical protein
MLRLGAAYPLELAVLKDAQQLGLQLKGHVANFVKEQGAPVCGFETPYPARDCTRKGASFVAKKFAFQQSERNGRAVYFYERAIPPLAALVDGERNEFLSGSRLTFNQDGGIRGSDRSNEAENRLERLARSHDSTETIFVVTLTIVPGGSEADIEERWTLAGGCRAREGLGFSLAGATVHARIALISPKNRISRSHFRFLLLSTE